MKFYRTDLLGALLLLLVSHSLAAAENPLLASVPADTIVFSGNFELVNSAEYPLISLSLTPQEMLSQAEKQQLGKPGLFFYELYADLSRTLNASDTHAENSVFKDHYGLSEQLAAVFYTQGIHPVLKLWLEKEQNLLQVLDQASDASGLKYQLKHYKHQQYRSYAMDDGIQFIVSIQPATSTSPHATATLALLSNSLSEHELGLILGVYQPEKSLADTPKIKKIIQANHYLPVSVNFVDFEQLLLSFYSTEGNSIASVLSGAVGVDQSLSAYQTPECKQDMLKLVREVPRLTAGYTQWQYDAERNTLNNELKMILELNNQNVKAELQRFKGFIPAYVRKGNGQNIFAFGAGADLAQLSPMFFYVSQAFKNTRFKCQPLLRLQEKVARTNPAMVALMTGVLDGIYGFAMAVQDIKFVPLDSKQASETRLGEVSFLASIATENPLRIWQLLSGFNSATAQLIPSATPQKVKFSILEASGIELFLAIKGKHLVLYSGQPAEQMARELEQEAVSSNGLIYESVNYSRLFDVAKQLKQSITSGNDHREIPAQSCIYFDELLARMSRLSGTMVYDSDFTESGWTNIIKTDIEVRPLPGFVFPLEGRYQTFSVADGCQLSKEGIETIVNDGSGLYQQYSEDGQCFIFETRYRWQLGNGKMHLQYVSEHSRPEGLCHQEFSPWQVPQAEYVNDSCDLRIGERGGFSCTYKWDDLLNKIVYKPL